MHACEKSATNERDLIDDQQHDALTLLLQSSESFTCELVLPWGIREAAEARARSLGSEANVEGSNARVCGEPDSGINVLPLKQQTHMLHYGLQRRGFAAASRAAQP